MVMYDGPVWIAIQPSCTGFLQAVPIFGDPELKHVSDRYNAVFLLLLLLYLTPAFG